MNGGNHRGTESTERAGVAGRSCAWGLRVVVSGMLAGVALLPAAGADKEAAVSCFVGAAELPGWREREGLVVVDTRSAEALRRVRIPGAIQSAPQALRHRVHLRDRPLLLVPRGPSGRELEPTCRELRAAGFRAVGILEGGLRSWANAGYPLVGDGAAVRELAVVHASEVWRERAGTRWLVVDLTAHGEPAVRELARHSVRIPPADPIRLRRALQAVLDRRSRRRSMPFVALVDDDGSRREALAAAVAGMDVPNLYFLADGAAGLRRFRHAHAAILTAQARDCPSQRCGGR